MLAGARYLQHLLDRYARTDLALAAYNAGPTAVDRAGGVLGPAGMHYVLERRAALGRPLGLQLARPAECQVPAAAFVPVWKGASVPVSVARTGDSCWA